MRSLAAVILAGVVLLSAPVGAQQKPHRRECIKLTQQIARYERDARWANERGNELWEDKSLAQMTHLADRRARLCPEFRQRNPFRQLADVVAKAAELALKYYLKYGF